MSKMGNVYEDGSRGYLSCSGHCQSSGARVFSYGSFPKRKHVMVECTVVGGTVSDVLARMQGLRSTYSTKLLLSTAGHTEIETTILPVGY